eukprot:804505-Alexandrium_andersonii.AAC.1
MAMSNMSVVPMRQMPQHPVPLMGQPRRRRWRAGLDRCLVGFYAHGACCVHMRALPVHRGRRQFCQWP